MLMLYINLVYLLFLLFLYLFWVVLGSEVVGEGYKRRSRADIGNE